MSKHAIPDAEEFAAWRDQPVTRWVMECLRLKAIEQLEGWTMASWRNGNCDPLLRMELATRADTFSSLNESGYEDFRSTFEGHQ